MTPDLENSLTELVGEVVVVDLASPYVCIGRLAKAAADFLVLEEVDVHDLRDVATTREEYILDCRRYGVRANRRRAWLSRHEIVSLSALADVLLY